MENIKSLRNEIITHVQKVADTKKQKIDASIVSRVASITIDTISKLQSDLLKRKKDR